MHRQPSKPRRGAIVTIAALLVTLAACTPPGETPDVVRLDTLTPATGAPGTALEVTGRLPADATLQLCGVALANFLLSEPESAAATHFTRATGTVPNLAPDTTCDLTVVRGGQAVSHTGATLTFSTDAVVLEAPDAPANLNATAGNATLAITFHVAHDGGSPVTLLEYTLDGGASWNDAVAAASPLLLAGLPNEETVTIRLRVTNAAGTSPISDSITATPTLWPFATRGGGTSFDDARAVSTLADGSAIITGSFLGITTFGATTLVSAGSFDTFVAKANADGTWAWATRAGGASFAFARSVSTLADGSAIVAGYFGGTATFGATSLTSAGEEDAFVAKTNPDGSWAWAARAGGTDDDRGRGVSTLADGSAIIAGTFEGAANFGATTLTSAGEADLFVAKIHADGSWAWATRAGDVGTAYATGVSALADSSAIITGGFVGTATFGATTLTSIGSHDIFVAKIHPDGTWAWASHAGGTSNFDIEASGISALADGSAIVTGYFTETATFGATTLTSAGSLDVFAAKTNADGTWAWATRAGGASNVEAKGISSLADGSAIVTGYLTETATFGGTTLTSAGGDDAFVARVDPDGSWAWATRAGGASDAEGASVSTLADGGAIVTGYFEETATFGATTLTSAGNWDVFIAKVSANGAW